MSFLDVNFKLSAKGAVRTLCRMGKIKALDWPIRFKYSGFRTVEKLGKVMLSSNDDKHQSTFLT